MTNTTKPSRQEMIDAIYKKIARKDIDLWCKIKLKTGVINTAVWKPAWPLINCLFFRQIKTEDIGEIIGHPVMIGDVIDFIEKNTQGVEPEQKKWEGVIKIQLWCSRDKAIEIFTDHIIFVWQNKRFSIEEQSDKCINFIYDLISK